MIVATIVALTWLFVSAIAGAPGNWGYLFWLPWVIGGLCCGIVSVVVDERGWPFVPALPWQSGRAVCADRLLSLCRACVWGARVG